MAAPHLGIAGLMPRSVERLVDLMGAPYGGRTMKQLFLRDARCGAPRRGVPPRAAVALLLAHVARAAAAAQHEALVLGALAHLGPRGARRPQALTRETMMHVLFM